MSGCNEMMMEAYHCSGYPEPYQHSTRLYYLMVVVVVMVVVVPCL